MLLMQRRKGERESLRLGKRGLESDEVSGEESSQPLTKRRKLEVPTCADCDKQKNEEMLECSGTIYFVGNDIQIVDSVYYIRY
jgi:hypothetical protein